VEKKSPDRLLESLQTGRAARALLEGLDPLLSARQAQIVREAVQAFRSGGLDASRATAYIAALSEVLALKEELEYRIRRGEEASKDVYPATIPAS